MKTEISVKKVYENLSGLRKAMLALTEQDVFIGIPEDKTAREAAGDTGISNAYLGYIHEHGVPEKNIPARDALIPGIQDIQAEAVDILRDAAKSALEGNAGAVEAGLNKIGLLGQNAVRARFVNNDWTPLSDKTLDRRPIVGETVKTVKKKAEDGSLTEEEVTTKRYGRSRREKQRVNPLIDTSQLRKAYTYVIRKRGNQALVVK